MRHVRPNLIIIGAQKSGTTSLWDNLRQHPEIFMCQPKEPCFFAFDTLYSRGWDWYSSLFNPVTHETIAGEASTHYSMTQTWPKAPLRIAQHLPTAKIIYIVRDPLERLRSAWLQFISCNYPIPWSFSKAIREYPPLLDGSMYWRTLSAYREHFDDSQILLLFFEDLKSDTHLLNTKCFRFLDVDDGFEVSDAENIRYRTAGRKMERPIVSRIRRVPGSSFLRSVLPHRVARNVRDNWARVRLPEKPAWNPRIKQWAVDQIKEDAHDFLNYAGKPLDFWGLH
ncbi:MAG: sulfotransferase domain-containing protein [Nitrococcus sp.]|nr:sulfotransferase domain-containing protein [Nitrococcus sp.]